MNLLYDKQVEPMPNSTTAEPRDGARTRGAVLDAAERLFAERGFDGTSLNEIGAEAGVSRGTPGYFFGSKAELYQTVLDRCFDGVRTAIRSGRERALASSKSPEVVLAGAVAEYFDFITAHPHFVRLMEWEALSGRRGVEQAPPHVDVVREALDAMSAELDVQPGRQKETAQLLLSIISLCWFPLVHGSALLPALDIDQTDPLFTESRKRHVIDLVMRGARELLALPGDDPTDRSILHHASTD